VATQPQAHIVSTAGSPIVRHSRSIVPEHDLEAAWQGPRSGPSVSPSEGVPSTDSNLQPADDATTHAIPSKLRAVNTARR
jgi:hypothetical protein